MPKRKKRTFRKQIRQDIYFNLLKEAKPFKDRKVNRLLGIQLVHKIKLNKANIHTINRIRKWLNRAIRPLEEWKPIKSRDPRLIILHLVKHLFVKYKMPQFMLQAWWKGSEVHQNWFIEISKGANIRTLEIPIHYTKKMSHFFMQAPAHLSIHQGLRWGQVKGMGGSELLANAIVDSRLGENFENDHFWSKVILFLINQEGLWSQIIHQIIEYIYDQKFQVRRFYTNEGECVEEPPPHPGFSIKGRTLMALFREARIQRTYAWQQDYWSTNKEWTGFAIPNYETTSGIGDQEIIYRITQITNAKDLYYEGKVMSHCVATYKHSCVKQKLSIWSLKKYQNDKAKRLLTISIDPKGKILEAKGKCNRPPQKKELKLVQQWLKSESFSYLGD